jgi:hypothetical protein
VVLERQRPESRGREEKKSRNDPLIYRVWELTVSSGWLCHMLSGKVAVCDQKTSKVLVSCGEEFMTGHVHVNGVY